MRKNAGREENVDTTAAAQGEYGTQTSAWEWRQGTREQVQSVAWKERGRDASAQREIVKSVALASEAGVLGAMNSVADITRYNTCSLSQRLQTPVVFRSLVFSFYDRKHAGCAFLICSPSQRSGRLIRFGRRGSVSNVR
jgi:hypothetical protein